MLQFRVLSRLSSFYQTAPLFKLKKPLSVTAKLSNDVRYSNRHEWVKVERNICTVGLSEYASKQLGDVVYIELPQIDAKLHKDDEVGVVESVKAATELYSPVGGTVKHINTKVVDKPSLLNKSPQDDGWLFKLELSSPEEVDSLMTASEYKDFLDSDEC